MSGFVKVVGAMHVSGSRCCTRPRREIRMRVTPRCCDSADGWFFTFVIVFRSPLHSVSARAFATECPRAVVLLTILGSVNMRHLRVLFGAIHLVSGEFFAKTRRRVVFYSAS